MHVGLFFLEKSTHVFLPHLALASREQTDSVGGGRGVGASVGSSVHCALLPERLAHFWRPHLACSSLVHTDSVPPPAVVVVASSHVLFWPFLGGLQVCLPQSALSVFVQTSKPGTSGSSHVAGSTPFGLHLFVPHSALSCSVHTSRSVVGSSQLGLAGVGLHLFFPHLALSQMVHTSRPVSGSSHLSPPAVGRHLALPHRALSSSVQILIDCVDIIVVDCLEATISSSSDPLKHGCPGTVASTTSVCFAPSINEPALGATLISPVFGSTTKLPLPVPPMMTYLALPFLPRAYGGIIWSPGFASGWNLIPSLDVSVCANIDACIFSVILFPSFPAP